MIMKFLNRLQHLIYFCKKKFEEPLELKSLLCERSFHYRSAVEIKQMSNNDINDYLNNRLNHRSENSPLALSITAILGQPKRRIWGQV